MAAQLHAKRRWLRMPKSSYYIVDFLTGMWHSNTSHVFYTESQFIGKPMNPEAHNRLLASMASASTTMALLLTVSVQMMFMDWTVMSDKDKQDPATWFGVSLTSVQDWIASIGQVLAGGSTVLILCYIYAVTIAVIPLLNAVDKDFMDIGCRRYLRTTQPVVQLMCIIGGYMMFISFILGAWVRFEIWVAICVTALAISGWICHFYVVSNAFICLDPISACWLRLSNKDSVDLAERRVKWYEKTDSALEEDPSLNLDSSIQGSMSSRGAMSPLMNLCDFFHEALVFNGHNPTDAKCRSLATRFLAEELSLPVMQDANEDALLKILSSPVIGITLGEQLAIHTAISRNSLGKAGSVPSTEKKSLVAQIDQDNFGSCPGSSLSITNKSRQTSTETWSGRETGFGMTSNKVLPSP